MWILKLIQDILSVPAILVGVVSFVGLVVQKKTFSEVVSGSLKTILGFLILVAGAVTLIGSLNALGPMLETGFGIKGVVPNNEAIVAIAQKTLGRETALIMVFGFLVNILLARFTPFKFIWLTGHHSFYMAALISATLGTAGLSGAGLIILGAIILGLMQVLMPAWIHPYMKKVTGSDEIALGHFGTLGYFVSGAIGKIVGNPEDSTENIKFAKGLGFLRESLVATGITMIIVFLIASFAAGPSYVESKLSGGQNFLVYAILQALTFAAGVGVVIYGVRMIISEIVPAFKGIPDKIVPEAKPALDCPVTFPYAPNAVIIGFIFSFLGGILSMLLMPLFNLPVIIPGLVPHFFVGGTAGVIGNATGGRRGAIIGSFVNGIIISFGAAFLLPALGTLGFENTTFGDSDFQWLGILISLVARLFK
ncbi:PTS ascorbate transporter subunit IIC [Fervidobacterium pennivorans subsp. shakshaketiis]|uniref:PTS ascorbate transporter subunit IIC n=1 Tax=Fervidobacterium pennivorans TaxID=93466 RepID=UPI00355B6CEC